MILRAEHILAYPPVGATWLEVTSTSTAAIPIERSGGVIFQASPLEGVWLRFGLSSVGAASTASGVYLRAGAFLELNINPLKATHYTAISASATATAIGLCARNQSVVVADAAAAAAAGQGVLHAPLGLNTDFLVYYGSDFPMKNAMASAGTWGVTNVSLAPFSSGCPLSAIPLDSDGYPTSLPYTVAGYAEGQVVYTSIYGGSIPSPYFYPAGTYHVHWDGAGTVRMRNDGGTVTSSTSGFAYTVATPSSGGMGLVILASTLGNHVRNIRVLHPGETLASNAANPWNQHWLNLVDRFGMLRFMNWQATNRSTNTTTTWASRVPTTYYTQESMGRGMAIEHMVDLCNRLLIDPWFCLHHNTTSDYWSNLAQYLYDNLDSRLIARIELSNEIWNGVFPQHAYYRDAGLAASINLVGYNAGDPSPTTNPGGYQGVRAACALKMQVRVSAQMWAAFTTVFGASSPRVKRVMGCFVVNYSQTTARLVDYENVAVNPLAGVNPVQECAIAPYWGVAGANALELNVTMPILDLLALFRTDAYNETTTWVTGHQAVTASRSIPVSFYEHGFGAAYDNAANVPLQTSMRTRLLEARRHSGFQSVQAEFFRAAHAANMATIGCHLGFVFPPQNSGCWGALENEYQDPATAPTWLAILAELTALGA